MISEVLTRWARQYSLPDPTVPAEAVLSVRPAEFDDLAAACDHLFDVVNTATWPAHDGARRLGLAWSNPAPAERARQFARACARLSDDCSTAGVVIRTFAAAAREARDRVDRAYQHVQQAIDADPMLVTATHPSFDYQTDHALEVRRISLTRSVHAAATQARAALDRAASTLRSRIGGDPRDRLPATVGTPALATAQKHLQSADTRERAALGADLRSSSEVHRAFAEKVDRALTSASHHGAPVALLDYDPDHPPGQGTAAIAIGDVSTADTVSIIVPGVGNSPSDMAGVLGVADSFRRAADRAAPGSTNATIVWMGYDIPLSSHSDPETGTMDHAARTALDAWHAMDDDQARAGGERLSDFCAELRPMMDPTAGLTLIGHSYGSTVVSQAARVTGRDAGIDDIVLLASPGAGQDVDDAGDYSAVAADHVYALSYPEDPVASNVTDGATSFGQLLALGPLFGGIWAIDHGGHPFGEDPADEDFDAQVIRAPSNVPAHGNPISNLDQHPLTNYLSGQGLDAVAAVTTGQYSDVPMVPAP